jgi:5'-nucleotidase
MKGSTMQTRCKQEATRMHSRILALAAPLLLALSACATTPPGAGGAEQIQLLALNDFHGNLQPTGRTTYSEGGQQREEQLGGAARIGAALTTLRAGQEHSITVAAGDLIGASPLSSAHFLDEPSIMALNRMGLELASVGNHEFDRGTAELRRMQQGGCDKHTTREPCQIDRPFEGARFTYLAANVLDEAGETLFPGTSIKSFGPVQLGFVGMTLKGTQTLVSPAGTRGFTFADEAETANAAAERLLAQGADAIVLLIHQGGYVDPANNAGAECPGLTGDILPILDRLSPDIRLVISGHTHNAYVCRIPAPDGTERLLTSAGRYGNFVTDLRLEVDPRSSAVLTMSARNVPVSSASGEQADIAALVARYVEAAQPLAERRIGTVHGSSGWAGGDTDSPVGNLLTDAQLAATQADANGGAQLALLNSGGVRAPLEPAADGAVTYGQLFALQPFGNTLVVVELTGAQLKALLEQQFTDESPARISQSLLLPSRGFTYAYDRGRPVGQRIVEMRLAGQPVEPGRTYRVTVNNFLASGGDGFSMLASAPMVAEGGVDLDALEAYVAPGVSFPAADRVRDVTAPPR